MKIEVDATYENGVLVLAHPLPIPHHQLVKLTIETEANLDLVKESYGMLGWTGDAETVRRAAMDPTMGYEE